MKKGDRVSLQERDFSNEVRVDPDKNVNFEILFEDEDIIVVNKSAGVVVHPGAGNHEHTLVNGLAYHCGENLSKLGTGVRPGVVHRIDKDTSGVLVAAKNDFSHVQLSKQFEVHSIRRKYICFVYSVLRPIHGKIETLIARSSTNRLKMSVSQNRGKNAITLYRTIKNFSNYASKVECELKTGRTHQIRVHLASLGNSLIGDKTYKFKNYSLPKEFSTEINEFTRQALHAYFLEFVHPRSGKLMHFECEMPDDMQNLEKILVKMESELCNTR